MTDYLPDKLEALLDERMSHLVFRQPPPDLPQRLALYLREQGVEILRQELVQGQVSWLVLSLSQPNTSNLVMEMVGQGFGEGVVGIDAKAVFSQARTSVPDEKERP